MRDIEHELAARENDGLDLDLVRELIMQKLKFAWTSTEELADARKALYEERKLPKKRSVWKRRSAAVQRAASPRRRKTSQSMAS